VSAIDIGHADSNRLEQMSKHVRSSGEESNGNAERFSPEQLRELLHRKTMAGERHRAHVARLLGMDATQAAALAHLAQHGQLTPGELGNLLGLTSGGTTALIHRLIDAGHLTRHPHPHDRRSSVLTASRTALDRAEELYASLVRDMDKLAGALSDVEREAVGRYLTAAAELAERHADRLDRRQTKQQPDIIAPPTAGLWT
jgi:DNA-binding MarR family transcriptional regulator